MKPITVIAFAVCLLASFAVVGTVSAQDHAAKATVPFGFNVGDKWVPAGTYTITSEGLGTTSLAFGTRRAPLLCGALFSPTAGDRMRANWSLRSMATSTSFTRSFAPLAG